MSFNYAPYIGAAIESVLAQTFQDWELLIVDDCSTDDSWSIIQSFDDPRIKTHRHAVNSGACAAYNQALSMAHGGYIACLDSDDLFMPTKLARQAAFLAEHPEIDICGTYVTEIDRNGFVASGETPYADWFNVSVDLNDPARWLWENRLCHSGAVVRAELHSRLGEFDNRLVYTPDWQFWLRALVAGARFAVIDQPLVGYRNHGSNITHKKPQGTLLEHAETSAHILFPWLQQQGRLDLIDKTVQGFMCNPALVSEIDLQTSVAKCLFSGSAAIDTGAAIMRLTIRREAELIAKEAQLAEVLKGKDWLENQWRETRQVLTERDAAIMELGQGKDWLEGQWKDIRNTLAEREAAILELQQSKDWHEAQRTDIQDVLTAREAAITELQNGKDWLEGQWKNIQALLAARDAAIAELQQGKDWLEGQWQNIQKVMVERDGAITDLQERRVWMERDLHAHKEFVQQNEFKIRSLESELDLVNQRLSQLRNNRAFRILKKIGVLKDG